MLEPLPTSTTPLTTARFALPKPTTRTPAPPPLSTSRVPRACLTRKFQTTVPTQLSTTRRWIVRSADRTRSPTPMQGFQPAPPARRGSFQQPVRPYVANALLASFAPTTSLEKSPQLRRVRAGPTLTEALNVEVRNKTKQIKLFEHILTRPPPPPIVCEPGYKCPGGMNRVPCLPGFFWAESGSKICDPCEAGTYQANPAHAECEPYFCPTVTVTPIDCGSVALFCPR